MRARLVLITTLLAVVVAACGGSGGSKSTTTTAAPTTATSAPSSTSGGSDAAATARAQKLLLTQSDFPAGWTGTPAAADTPEDKSANQEFATCAGIAGEASQSADVKGDDFSNGSPATQVGSEAQIIKDEATYKKDVDALKGGRFRSCLQDFLTKQLAKATGGAAPANVQITPLSTDTFGDVTVGFRMSAGLTVQGQTVTVILDAVAMGKNKAEVTGTFTNLTQPFDQTLEKSLIAKLGAKLDANS